MKLKKLTEYIFYLFLFLLPWQTRLIIQEGILNGGHWEWGTYSLYAVDIVFIILGVTFFLAYSTQPKLKIKNEKLKLVEIIILCFLLFAFLSIFRSDDKKLAFYWWLRIFQGVILFFLIQKIDFNFVKAGFSLVLSGVIQSFLGISQFINQKVFASKWLGIAFQDPMEKGVSVIEINNQRILRVYGSLPHPNILAGFLVFIIFVSFFIYFLTKKSWQKYFLLFFTFLITLTLFLTFSRAAFLSLIFNIFLFGLLTFKKRWRNFQKPFLKFFGLIIIISIIFGTIFLKNLTQRFRIQERLEKISVNERIMSFQKAEEIIKENIFFGVGIGNYTLALFKKYPNLSSFDYQPVANIYFLIWAELGLVGLILFFLIIVLSLRFDLYSLWLTNLVILGFFDHWLFSLSFGIIIFWLNLGWLWKTKNEILDRL